MAETLTSIAERVDAYVEALNNSSSDHHTYGLIKGRKYLKVVDGTRTDGGPLAPRSVHAFIEISTGFVFKPAGWQAPAKHVRFRLMHDASYAELIGHAKSRDAFSGGYLYL